jgi:HSP20 family protein
MDSSSGDHQSPFLQIHDELDRMVEEFNGYACEPLTQRRAWAPPVDVYEKDSIIYVEAEVPGICKQSVSLTCKDNTLIIKGDAGRDTEDERADYHHSERRHGRFSRTIVLPCCVDFSKTEAQMSDGVLQVKLPKLNGVPSLAHAIPIR